MKKIKIGSVLVAISLMIACTPESKYEIGNHYAAGEGIIGTWELTTVEQTDLGLPIPESEDISYIYERSTDKWVITFNTDSTYVVQSKGPGPDIFPTNGNWKYDKMPFPTTLIMGDTDSTMAENGLLNMPRTIDREFGFEFVRNGCEKDIVKYAYTFRRK